MKVLITGGAGFIGSHLTERFSSLGDEVTILDNFSTGAENTLKQIGFRGNLIEGDIRNHSLVDKLIEETELVLHMAAALGVSNIMNSTLESISTNILGSEVVLLSAAKHNKRIFIASSSEIYGKNPKQPLTENDDRVIGSPQNFRWTYSDSKAIEESIARVLYLEKKLPVTTLRFFNTIGPRQSAKYGMVVPRFIEAAINGDDIKVYGDGSQTRVFCHVYDAVEGLISLLNTESSIGEVYNVGGIGEISILSLAKKVIEVTGSKSKIITLPYTYIYPIGYEDMQRRVPDTSKIKLATGWVPSHNLESTIIDIANSINL
jgi:UDP-glucose 4-epimerase